MATVYVLGAGASKALIPDAPLMGDLLPTLLSFVSAKEQAAIADDLHIAVDEDWADAYYRLDDDAQAALADRLRLRHGYKLHQRQANGRDTRLQDVAQFIQEFYGVTEGAADLPQLEEVLSQLDYAIANPDDALSSIYTVAELQHIRLCIIYGIGKVLQYLLEIPLEYQSPKAFLRKLSPDDTLISLNYDLIVDNGIHTLDPWHIAVNYGFEPRDAISGDAGRMGYFSDDRPLFETVLYKLHGSLNWLYCPQCDRIDVTEGLKGVLYAFHPPEHNPDLDYRTCPVCEARYEPVIVTPTFLKTYGNPFLEKIWRAAEDRLQHADRVVFAGYSLPDADMILRSMFKRAIFTNNRVNGRPCQIEVVDYAPEYVGPDGSINPDADSHPTCRRYRRLFGPHVQYDPRGFRHFMKLPRLD
jgi:hypothetical protein